MIALRWVSFLLGALSLICLWATTERDLASTLLAVFFAACFITFCWTVGAFAGGSDNQKGTTS